ncbi:hypothetical protein GE09DRAFT_1228231 [Coniochaeta sp. 2T2.1]|nr:hypothetical protein GE09DRAFT_1228231 [Coniochaeta sp. 2T2.1]
MAEKELTTPRAPKRQKLDNDGMVVHFHISDIIHDGDVVFLVGPEKTPLKVYSQCLRTGSKVFNSMLGPTWSEGKGLSSLSPPEIPLEEDDADALRTIFFVLHHRNREVPASSTLTPSDILNIAVMSDKYDLAVALEYVRLQWLKPREGLDLLDIGRLATAALLMGDSRMFVAHTMELMLNWEGPYLELLDDEAIGQFLPFKAVYLLERRRTQMRADIYSLIAKNCTYVSTPTCTNGLLSCVRATQLKTSYSGWIKFLQDYLPLQLLAHKLPDVFPVLARGSLEDPELQRRINCAVPFGRRTSTWHEGLTSAELVAGRIDAIKKRAEICMDCVRGADQCKKHDV